MDEFFFFEIADCIVGEKHAVNKQGSEVSSTEQLSLVGIVIGRDVSLVDIHIFTA